MTDISLSYTCPRCDHRWLDEWSCLVDADCPRCEARDITPVEDD